MPIDCPPDNINLPAVSPSKCTEQTLPLISRQLVKLCTTFNGISVEMWLPLPFILDNVLNGIGAKISTTMNESRAFKNCMKEVKERGLKKAVIGFNVEYAQSGRLSITNPYISKKEN